ncbi:MAG: hypothetical protein JSR34_12685 [Proteobacteria bacterium]|nr:hypothetical protein [Pseudomonadota bacterium]
MSECRFPIRVQIFCLVDEATGVMVKGGDGNWRYWIEFDGRCIPGDGEFSSTREGTARLQARAEEQLWKIIYPPSRSGLSEDIQ